MRRIVLVLACALAGCTVANPLYAGGGDGGAPPSSDAGGVGGVGGGGEHPDFAAVADFAVGGGATDAALPVADLAPAGPADLAHPGECGPTERSCTTIPTPSSEACIANKFTADRRCPYSSFGSTGAVCSDGYCQPPTGNAATGCSREADCGSLGGGPFRFSCQPFIDDPQTGKASWWCGVGVSTSQGTAGTSCKANSDCRNDLCGGNGSCFYACQRNSDCPTRTHCAATTLTVEGAKVPAQSCIP